MGAETTIYVSREKALAAYAAHHYAPTDGQLEDYLNELFRPNLINVRVVYDQSRQCDYADAYISPIIGGGF